jgi:hypothetical protein
MSDGPDLEYALVEGTFFQVHQKASGENGELRFGPSGAVAEE